MKTQLYHHPVSLKHDTPPGHPERPDRIRALMKALEAPEFEALERIEAPMAEESLALLAHPQGYIDAIKGAIPATGRAALDPDTHVSPDSLEAALRALGANRAAVDAVLAGDAKNAFCALRPPGHHAERNRAMGFCLFSTVAIAAKYALQDKGLSRVAIIDFDVHHGNGTQDVVEDDPQILFISSHQSPLYPGTGAADETGCGNVVNLPLRSGFDGADYMRLFEERIAPAVKAHKPELIFISAGFDAHIDDPLASLALTAEDFGEITTRICALAQELCQGRVASSLEGGYDLEGLASSAAAHVRALMEAAK